MIGGSITHNVACSAAQPSAYRLHVKWQIVFHRHRTPCQFGTLLVSKQVRLPCCMLEMCSRSGTYNSINSSHSACARMALNTDSKQAQCHFSSRKHREAQIQILRIHKVEGGGMLSNNSKVSWLKLKLQTVGIFFGMGPGKSSLHLSKHAIAGRATA